MDHANVTVRNCKAYSLNPNVAGEAPGRFIDVENFDNLVVVNGKFDSGQVSALTDSSGKYQILGLAPGAYQVRVVELSGYVRTNPISGYRGVTLNSGELDDGWDFGFSK